MLVEVTEDFKKAKGQTIKKGTILNHYGKPNFKFKELTPKKAIKKGK